MPGTPVARLLIVLICLDALFTSLVAYSYLVMMSIEGGTATRTALALFAVAWVIKTGVWTKLMMVRLKPLAQWVAGPTSDEETLRSVAAVAYRAPLVVSISWAVMFASLWVLVTLVIYFGFPNQVPLGPRALEGVLLVSLATVFGSSELGFPLVEWLLAPVVEQISLMAIERRIEIPGVGLSFRARLVAFALTLALGPTFYLSGVAYMTDARAGQRELTHHAQLAAAEEALGVPEAARRVGGWVFTFEPGAANMQGPEAMRVLEERPGLTRRFQRAAAGAPSGTASHPREGVVAFRTDGGRRIGVVIPDEAEVSSGTVLLILLFLVIMAFWGPMCATFIARSTAVPVMRISEALARVGEGEVMSAPRVPVFHQDEVGALAKTYNGMVDQLRELARRATAVAEGELDVDLGVRGELGDAFRGQLASLREVVGHIVRSASQLSGAATEMYSAAHEQERVAHQQSAGVEKATRTMESLLAAATHVTESTTGVLSRAERTRETTARTAERIAELSAHASRIGEILDVIREIADRSDMLAFNATIEGTRAGPAGRGFALVAAEMRKLAERVTDSVQDIKTLVGDVRSSVSATVTATEESSRLAEGTTESARHIHEVTQQQRSDTEQAEQRMRDVSSMISHSLAATQQIRSLAQDLKTQADNLTGLVAKFRLPAGMGVGKPKPSK